MEEKFVRGEVLHADVHTFSETHVGGDAISVRSSTSHWVNYLIRLQTERGLEEYVLTLPPQAMIGVKPGDNYAIAFAGGCCTYVANLTTEKLVPLSDPFRTGCGTIIWFIVGLCIVSVAVLDTHDRTFLQSLFILFGLPASIIAMVVFYMRERKRQINAYTNHQRSFLKHIRWENRTLVNLTGVQ
jgi:hypothetical protein